MSLFLQSYDTILLIHMHEINKIFSTIRTSLDINCEFTTQAIEKAFEVAGMFHEQTSITLACFSATTLFHATPFCLISGGVRLQFITISHNLNAMRVHIQTHMLLEIAAMIAMNFPTISTQCTCIFKLTRSWK
jgi:hypothetical protein